MLRTPLVSRLATALLAAMLVLTGANAWAAEKLVKKVDSFFFVVDRSGSMGFTYAPTGMSKVASAKKLLGELNTQIPELPYDGGLTTAAPFDVIGKPAPYSRTGYAKSIDAIDADVLFLGFLGNPTPLGQGLADLEPLLKASKGKSAVILMSDGEANTGSNPVEVAEALSKAYPVCFHTISYAQNESGQATLDKIAALNKCSVAAKASDLKDKTSQLAFLRKVLFDVETVAAPAPVAAPEKPKVSMKIKVLFDTDKWAIKPQYKAEVGKFAQFIAKYPDTTITVEGHTDSTGSAAHNQKLSQNRAQAVVDMLVKDFGIKAERLKAVGFGPAKPVSDNKTAAGRAENRRTVGVLDNVYEK